MKRRAYFQTFKGAHLCVEGIPHRYAVSLACHGTGYVVRWWL